MLTNFHKLAIFFRPMKKDIHPDFYEKATATCACGASFTVASTKENLDVEICSACHPFFTGQEKVLDSAGRVEKFKKRAAAKK
jgi:large subunit ribosomal protein L31